MHSKTLLIPEIQPISPQEFTTKITKGLYALYGYISSIAVPLAIVILSIGAIFYIASSLMRSGTGKKIGLASMLVALSGLMLFWGIPTIVGVAQHIANIMK